MSQDLPELQHSTGDVQSDRLLAGVVAIFEVAFPERVLGYYVLGSRADQSAVGGSDLDLDIVFRGALAEEERRRAEHLARGCRALCTAELDIDIVDEAGLARGAWPTFKWASLLVYGEDLRERVPLIDLREWTRDRMHTSYWRLARLYRRLAVVRFPLEYPDPHAEFYGYAVRPLRLPDGAEVPSTRDLIRATGWAATAIVAYTAGQYVATKRDCHRLYQQYAGDEEGARLLHDIYEYCRGRWQYRIPEAREERLRLRDICARTLAFENHFLRIYKEFLLTELRLPVNVARERAFALQREIPYQDEAILAALRDAGEARD